MSKPKEVVNKYNQIVDRIEAEGLSSGDRLNLIIMISVADDKFQLQLDEMLNAPDDKFRHEIADMCSFFDWEYLKFIDDRFVSRFACEEIKKENEIVPLNMKRKKVRELIQILNKHGENVEYFARQMNWSDRKTKDYVKTVKSYAALLDLKLELNI